MKSRPVKPVTSVEQIDTQKEKLNQREAQSMNTYTALLKKRAIELISGSPLRTNSNDAHRGEEFIELMRKTGLGNS